MLMEEVVTLWLAGWPLNNSQVGRAVIMTVVSLTALCPLLYKVSRGL